MRHLDLFSGIGGFSLGLKQAGINITSTQFSEIDKYAISVYQNQFKDAEYVGSVTDVIENMKKLGFVPNKSIDKP